MNPVDTGPIQDNGTQVVTPTAPGSVLPPAPQSMAGPPVLAPAPPTAVAPAAVQPPPSVSLAVPPPINRPAPAVSLTSPVVSPPAPKPSWLHFNRIAFWVSGAAVLLIIAIAAVSFVLLNSHTPAGQTNSNYGVTSLPLQNAQADAGQLLGKASKLDVNGQLRVNDTLVLTPGSKPSSPVAGQLYYDKSTNQPYYYNGINFVALTGAAASGASQNVSQPNITQITQIQGSSGSGAATCAYGACVSLQAGAPGVAQAGNVNVSGTVTAGQLNAGSVNAGSYNVNGSPLASGNLADAANIALLNRSGQTFSGSNTFTGSLVAAGDSTAEFQVQDAGGDNLLNADTIAGTVTVGDTSSLDFSTPEFTQMVQADGTNSPAGVAGGNFCNNGLTDLAIANSDSDTISIFCDSGSGVANDSSASATLNTGSEPYDLVTGNFCNNGRTDLAVNNYGDNTASVFCNTGAAGAGAFGADASAVMTTGDVPSGIAAGDLCGNGRADLVIPSNTDGTADVYCNTGGRGGAAFGGAATMTVNTGYDSYGAATGNFCNNGRTDFAVPSIESSAVTIYCNTGQTGASAFGADATETLTGDDWPADIITGNFCNNGQADLAITNTYNASVYCNTGQTGAGAYNTSPDISLNTGQYAVGIDSGDYCGNGKADIAVANVGDGTADIYCNTGSSGTAAYSADASVTLNPGSDPYGLATGDFCNDGKADLAISSMGDNDIAFYCNSPVNFAGTSAGAALVVAPAADTGEQIYVSPSQTSALSILDATDGGVLDSFAADGSLTIQSTDGLSLLNASTANDTVTISGADGGFSASTPYNALTGNSPGAIAVSGNYAYVVNTDDNDMQIFDISNPAAVTQVGSDVITGNSPWGVAVSGNYAYVVNFGDSTLQIFDVSDPTNVTQVGSDIPTGGGPNGIAVSGNYAYVVNFGDSTLQVFDISDPTNVTQVGSDIPTGNNPWGVAISGQYLYVTNNVDDDMQIFDVSDPTNVTQVGSDVVTDGDPVGVAVSGNYAYTISDADDMQIFDVSDPTNVTQAGSMTTNDSGLGGVAVSGNYLYLVSADNDTLQIFDISGDPTNPEPYEQSSPAGGYALQVNGAASFQNTADSNSAFLIQDAEGNSLLNVDTDDDELNIGAATGIQADSSNAFNVSDSSGDSLLNVDTYDSQLDVNADTVDFQNTDDSTSAFQVQDAEGNTLLNVDTQDSQLDVNADNTLIQPVDDSTSAFQVQDAENNNVVNVDTTDHTLTVSGQPTNSLGPNLITNDDFSDTTYWTASTYYGTGAWTLGPNSAAFTGNNYATDELAITTSQFAINPGATYFYSFTLSGATGDLCVNLSVSNSNQCGASDGVYSGFASDDGGNTDLYFDLDAQDGHSFSGTISNVYLELVQSSAPPLVVQSTPSVEGSVTGSELSLSNDFTNATDWTATPSGDWTLTDGSATFSNNVGGGDALDDNQVTVVPTASYQITFTLSGIGGPWYVCFPVPGGCPGGSNYTDGTHVVDISTLGYTGPLEIAVRYGTGTISNISVDQLVTSNYTPAALTIQDSSGNANLEIRAPDSGSVYIGLQSGVNDNDTVYGSNFNTALGDYAMQFNTTGFGNTALGNSALLDNITGSDDTALGYGADVGSDGLQNATAIGVDSEVDESNALVLGCVSGINYCSTTPSVGIGTTAPANLLSIGDLTTASPGAQIAVSTGGTTNSGIIVQTVASQSSGYVFQAQDSTGAALASIDYQGNLAVKSATIDGHIITGNASGTTTATLQTGAGTGGSPACTVTGDDTAGLITLTTGTAGWAAGAQCTINFSADYAAAPHPVITPTATTNATVVTPTVTATTGGFTVNFINADTAQHTYTWDYFNAQ